MGIEKGVSIEEKQRTSESLRNILITFAAFNQKIDEKILNDERFDLGYAQG